MLKRIHKGLRRTDKTIELHAGPPLFLVEEVPPTKDEPYIKRINVRTRRDGDWDSGWWTTPDEFLEFAKAVKAKFDPPRTVVTITSVPDDQQAPLKRPYHAKPWQDWPDPESDDGEFGPAASAIVKRYQTPGPGPSSGIKQSDLELSKVDRAVEDIRGIIHTDASNKAASIRFELSKIEKSIKYLKERG